MIHTDIYLILRYSRTWDPPISNWPKFFPFFSTFQHQRWNNTLHHDPDIMSASLISRRLVTARVLPMASRVGLRYNSTKSDKITTNTSNDTTKINASEFLVPLSQSIGSASTAASEAEEAAEWLSAIRELRNDFTKNGTSSFMPNKAFGPDDTTEINLVQQALEAENQNRKFSPSENQSIKAAQLQGVAVPVKTDPIIQYLTNIIMSHGRKARAQRIMSEALYLVHLQTRADPVELIKDTLEKMAPVLRLRRYTDGGARAEMIPVPLNERQRLRHAWTWIVDGSDKRASKSFSVRLAEEILAASKGSGAGFDKKESLHKAGIAARSFIKKL